MVAHCAPSPEDTTRWRQSELQSMPTLANGMLDPGAGMPYDTLDNLPDEWHKDMPSFRQHVLEPLMQGACGFGFGGMAALTDPSDGYWGRAMGLCTGETLQVRIMPRGVAGKGIPPGTATVSLAFRRACASFIPQSWTVTLFSPQDWDTFDRKEIPSYESYTAGCRGLHLILPSDFSKHDAQRDVTDTKPEHDANGFHTIRPYSISVSKVAPRQTKNGPEVRFTQSVTPGNSYMAVAAAMVGAQVPDPLVPSVIELTEGDMMRQAVSMQRALTRTSCCDNPCKYITAGLTVLDALTAEGVASMLCHEFFRSALTDMMHSPIGLVLCIVMAVRIAAFPDIFGLGASTPVDEYANQEVRAIFEARWGPVLKGRGLRAIDCALKAGLENATLRTNGEEHGRECLRTNLKYWQRLGQRMATKMVSDTLEGGAAEREERLQTQYGRADLVADDVTAARYAVLNKQGFARPLKESPVDRIIFSTRADIRTTVYRMHDSVEHWLRTGMYGDQRLSGPNVNVASDKSDGATGGDVNKHKKHQKKKQKPEQTPEPGAVVSDETSDEGDSTSEEDSDCCDDVLDNVLNKSAMESASGAVSLALMQGGAVMHQFGISSYVVGPGATSACADCDATVHVLDAIALNTRVGQCTLCSRHRCTTCQIKALRARVLSPDVVGLNCKRCMPVPGEQQKKKKEQPSPAWRCNGKKHAFVVTKVKKEA